MYFLLSIILLAILIALGSIPSNIKAKRQPHLMATLLGIILLSTACTASETENPGISNNSIETRSAEESAVKEGRFPELSLGSSMAIR